MPVLKRHVELTAERLAEMLSEAGPTWIPLCENTHKEPAYAEYMTELGVLTCAGCTFCRECEQELEYMHCGNPECILYLRPARHKDG